MPIKDEENDQQKSRMVCEIQFGQNKKFPLLQRHVNRSRLADHFGLLPNVETEPMVALAEVAVTVGKPLVEGGIHSGGRSCKISHSYNTPKVAKSHIHLTPQKLQNLTFI